uniref:CCHC-type domain-containing protein n=1 Tax=Neogobius melanostomus TaxID=47308 RepID=A0A8C6SAR9_9GOBI
MNSADSDPLSHTLAAQSSLLEQHDHTLTALMEHMKEFSVSIASLRTQMTALVPQAAAATGHTPPAPPPAQAPVLPPSTREAYVPPPAPYSGDLGTCKSFLTQCSLIFEQQPYTYANDRTKICYLIGCLRGPALSWASAVWEKQTLSCSSYLAFTTEMKQIFDHPVRGKEATRDCLTSAREVRRLNTRSCLYCGHLGHFLSSCPVRPAKGPAQQ